MTRPSQLRAWLILLSAAVALVVACGSSSTPAPGDEDAAQHVDAKTMTKG